MSKYLANFALSVVVFIVLPIISTLLIMRAVAGVDVRGALIQADVYAAMRTAAIAMRHGAAASGAVN